MICNESNISPINWFSCIAVTFITCKARKILTLIRDFCTAVTYINSRRSRKVGLSLASVVNPCPKIWQWGQVTIKLKKLIEQWYYSNKGRRAHILKNGSQQLFFMILEGRGCLKKWWTLNISILINCHLLQIFAYNFSISPQYLQFVEECYHTQGSNCNNPFHHSWEFLVCQDDHEKIEWYPHLKTIFQNT